MALPSGACTLIREEAGKHVTNLTVLWDSALQEANRGCHGELLCVWWGVRGRTGWVSLDRVRGDSKEHEFKCCKLSSEPGA